MDLKQDFSLLDVSVYSLTWQNCPFSRYGSFLNIFQDKTYFQISYQKSPDDNIEILAFETYHYFKFGPKTPISPMATTKDFSHDGYNYLKEYTGHVSTLFIPFGLKIRLCSH